MATPPRARSLTLAQQAFGLRSAFPDATLRLGRQRLTWQGKLRPSELSDPYLVKITYQLGRYPAVRPMNPAITDTDEFVHTSSTTERCASTTSVSGTHRC